MKILIAVDGSECSVSAVEETARTPWPEGSAARIVSVVEPPAPAPPEIISLSDGSYEELERILEDGAVEVVNRAMNRFEELSHGNLALTSGTLKGDPKAALLEEAEEWDADLIVLGDHGYGALKRFWMGSVSRTVAAHASCSVLISRRREKTSSQPPTKIVLAVDGSECSLAATQEIVARPWPKNSEVHVISVIQLPFTPTAETRSLPDSEYSQLEKMSREQAEADIRQSFQLIEERNSQREFPLKLSNEIVLGRPEEGILDAANQWGADLIIVGSQGRRGIQRFLLGSTSSAVASHAPCSVQIVRRKKAAQG